MKRILPVLLSILLLTGCRGNNASGPVYEFGGINTWPYETES